MTFRDDHCKQLEAMTMKFEITWALFEKERFGATDLLKDINHRLPRTRREHVALQQSILREKVLENSIFDLRTHARNVVGANSGLGSYFSCVDGVEPRPLYMRLGDPGGQGALEDLQAGPRHLHDAIQKLSVQDVPCFYKNQWYQLT